MKEEEPNWFSRWEEELPSPDELMPLSQTLITSDLAVAFDIPTHPDSSSNYSRSAGGGQQYHPGRHTPLPPSHLQSHSQQQQQVEYDSSDLGGGGGGGGDEQARTLKRPRLVWTPQLHKRFVDAVSHLGIKNAVPKTIMQLMSVDGLTRENVASHLQKYRLYLKRMQGLSQGGGGVGGPVSTADSAMDQLFASAPVPHHFLNRGPPEQFVPFAPPTTAIQHHPQMAAAHQQQRQHYYSHRNMGHLGSSPVGGGGIDLGFQARHQQPGVHRMAGTAGIPMVPPPSMGSYAEQLHSGGGEGGKKVLSLFPTNDD